MREREEVFDHFITAVINTLNADEIYDAAIEALQDILGVADPFSLSCLGGSIYQPLEYLVLFLAFSRNMWFGSNHLKTA